MKPFTLFSKEGTILYQGKFVFNAIIFILKILSGIDLQFVYETYIVYMSDNFSVWAVVQSFAVYFQDFIRHLQVCLVSGGPWQYYQLTFLPSLSSSLSKKNVFPHRTAWRACRWSPREWWHILQDRPFWFSSSAAPSLHSLPAWHFKEFVASSVHSIGKISFLMQNFDFVVYLFIWKTLWNSFYFNLSPVFTFVSEH